DFLRGAERNVDRIVFFVLTKEAGLAFLEYADDFEVVTAHAYLRACDLVVTRKQRVSSVHADDHHVRALLIVGFSDEASFPERDIRYVCVVWRNALRVTPTIIATLISDVVVERSTTVTNIRRDVRDFFDRGRLSLDRFSVRDCERLSEALGTILARAWSSGEMERVDVVRSILFDHRDDILTQAGEQ